MTDSPSTAPLPLSPAPPRRRWLGRVLALLLVLALLGVGIVRFMTWIEKRLLHWQ